MKKLVLFLFFLLMSAPVFSQQLMGQDVSMVMTATPNEANNRITLNWIKYASYAAEPYTIWRKEKSATSWGNPVATVGSSVSSWADNNVTPGVYYEYRLERKFVQYPQYNSSVFVASGLNIPERDYNGIVILVIDQNFQNPLSTAIANMETDLARDGWKVKKIFVLISDSKTSIKNQITSKYNEDPTNTKAVFLMGRIPSHYINADPDGHGSRSFTSDKYYGDVNGASGTELMVGRIDFSDLPAFNKTETQMMGEYLAKLSTYKNTGYIPANKSLITVINSFSGGNGPYYTILGLFGSVGALTGPDGIEAIQSEQWLNKMSGNYLWSGINGFGGFDTQIGIVSTQNIVNTPNNAIFNVQFGSHMGNFNPAAPEGSSGAGLLTNNLMKATTASGKSLMCVYGAWFFHHMDMGDPVGYSAKITIDQGTGSDPLYQKHFWSIGLNTTDFLGLLGDPTLRQWYVKPPSNLIVGKTGVNINLQWTASPDQILGYNVYYFNNDVPVKINSTPIQGTSFTTQIASDKYMVRAVKKMTSNGTYRTMSLGAMGELNTVPVEVTVTVNAKVILGGAFNGTQMRTDLRASGLLPLGEPYSSMGYVLQNPNVQRSTNNQSNQFVDWVVVELRDQNFGFVGAKAAMVKRDGTVVSPTNGAVQFTIMDSPHYVVIRHRNHLPVSTSTALTNFQNVDFMTDGYGVDLGSMDRINDWYVMVPGDVNGDMMIKYTGENNDRDPLAALMENIPTTIKYGYYNEDVNLDGKVKYVGESNDRDIIFISLGNLLPSYVRYAILPN